jgi:O-antigen ligase
VNALLLAPFLSALLLIHALVGGTRLLYSLPAYGLLAVAAILAGFAKPPPPKARPAISCVITTLLLVAWVVVRAMLSPVTYLWWNDFFMVLGCAAVYLLVTYRFTGVSERQLILGALMLLAMVEVVVSLYQFSRGNDYMLFDFRRPPSGRRASGMFISPNHLAGFLETIGLLALSCACWSRWRVWVRILVGYVALMCFAGVVVSGSRGGYLATVAGLLTFGIISVAVIAAFDRTRAFVMGVVGAVVLGGGGAITLYLMNESTLLRGRLDLLSSQFNDASRLDVRIYNWQATLDQFRVSPWIGTGAGTHLYYGRYFRRPRLQYDPIHAHSDYLELIAEYGIVGGAAMALFLGAHVRSGVRRLSGVVRADMLPRGEMSHERAGLLIGSLSALGAMAIHSVVDFNLHIPANALLFALIFGLLAGGNGAQPDQSRAFHWSRIALPALGLWLLLSGMPKIRGEYWASLARKAFNRLDLKRTVECATRAIEAQPENVDGYFYLGEAYRGFGTAIAQSSLRMPYFRKSVDAFRRGLEHFPQDEETWVRYGQALDGLRDFAGAETAYVTAINLDPNLGILYAYYAAHLRLYGRFEEADVQIENARRFMIRDVRPILQRALDAPDIPVK